MWGPLKCTVSFMRKQKVSQDVLDPALVTVPYRPPPTHRWDVRSRVSGVDVEPGLLRTRQGAAGTSPFISFSSICPGAHSSVNDARISSPDWFRNQYFSSQPRFFRGRTLLPHLASYYDSSLLRKVLVASRPPLPRHASLRRRAA